MNIFLILEGIGNSRRQSLEEFFQIFMKMEEFFSDIYAYLKLGFLTEITEKDVSMS